MLEQEKCVTLSGYAYCPIHTPIKSSNLIPRESFLPVYREYGSYYGAHSPMVSS